MIVTDRTICSVAREIIDNCERNYAAGDITESEKSGAKAAIVAMLILLGIKVEFIKSELN